MLKPKTDRRHPTEQDTKRTIVSTVCTLAVMLVFAIIQLALNRVDIPDPLDRLANLATGALIGFLAKTGVDAFAAAGQGGALPVTNAPGEALETKDVTNG